MIAKKWRKYTMLSREKRANEWVKNTLHQKIIQLLPLAGDASFRRYFRVIADGAYLILMDAPPSHESLDPFLKIARRLKNQGLTVPECHYLDKDLGFALFDDFGDKVFLSELTPANADLLYKLAIEQLILMQKTPTTNLSKFDADHMIKEMALFPEWFLKQYLKLRLSPDEEHLIKDTFQYLVISLEKQAQVFIHRDYHSRNLMIISNEESEKAGVGLLPASLDPAAEPQGDKIPEPILGILDFQDAMIGPYTYDLVSLLKDCYIQWPRQKLLDWLQFFYERSPIASSLSLETVTNDFDLCGLQRHLKVLGIFARLYLRDNKAQYLKDLPLTLHYVQAYLETNPKLQDFSQFLHQRVTLP